MTNNGHGSPATQGGEPEERASDFCVLFDGEGGARALLRAPLPMSAAEWREKIEAADRRWDEIDRMEQDDLEEFDRLPVGEREAWANGVENYVLYLYRAEGWESVPYAEASYRL